MTDLFGTVEDTRYYYFVNSRYVRFFWKNEKYYDNPYIVASLLSKQKSVRSL